MAENLLEHQIYQLLSEYSIPMLPYSFCTTTDEALCAASDMGYPVVLKVISPQITHKSDAGGVKLDLNGKAEVTAAYSEICRSAREYAPDAQIKGVLVTPFVKGRTELIIGAIRDPQFGPVVMAGLGGIYVEVYQDVSFGIAPVTFPQALKMLRKLKAWPILCGMRGKKSLNVDCIAELIVKVSEFIMRNPVLELDLNPVFCDGRSAVVGDARIILDSR